MSTEPSESPRSTYCVPFWSPVTAGGDSSPVKSVSVSSERPASTPMYAPDSSVPFDTPVAPTRGRTIQKRGPDREILRFLLELHLDEHARQVFRQLDRLDHADLDVLVLDLGLASSEPSALWKLIVICRARART